MSTRGRARDLADRLRGGGLATESAWGLGLELATMLGMVITFTLLGRQLGPERYAPYVALYAIVSPLVTLAASGVTLALLQHVVRDGEPLDETVRSCVSLTLLLGGGLTLVGAGAAFLLVDGLGAVAILGILLTEFVTAPLVMVAATTVQAATGFAGCAQIKIVFIAVRAAVVVALFLSGELTIRTLAVSMLIATTVLAFVMLRRVGRRYGFVIRPGRVRLHHMKTNGVYSVGISAAALNSDGDKLVLGAYQRFEVATGLYGAAWRIVNLGMVPVSSLVNVSHKRFLEHTEGVKGQHLRRAKRFAGLAGVIGLAISLVLMAAAPLLPLVLGDDFDGSVTMVRWLAPLVLIRSLAIFPLNGLMGLGRTFLRSIIIVLNAAVAMAFYLVLIPDHSWEGAVAGTLISEALLLASTWGALILCQRHADRAIEASAAADTEIVEMEEAADLPTQW